LPSSVKFITCTNGEVASIETFMLGCQCHPKIPYRETVVHESEIAWRKLDSVLMRSVAPVWGHCVLDRFGEMAVGLGTLGYIFPMVAAMHLMIKRARKIKEILKTAIPSRTQNSSHYIDTATGKIQPTHVACSKPSPSCILGGDDAGVVAVGNAGVEHLTRPTHDHFQNIDFPVVGPATSVVGHHPNCGPDAGADIRSSVTVRTSTWKFCRYAQAEGRRPGPMYLALCVHSSCSKIVCGAVIWC
jgi:hypothetical protein